MEQQIRVFFREKFDEIYQEQERILDGKRKRNIEKLKELARVEEGHKWFVEKDLKEKLDKVCKEYWALKKEQRFIESIMLNSQINDNKEIVKSKSLSESIRNVEVDHKNK